MKIKNLPKGTSLGNVKVKTPEGIVGWWVSQWPKGVWLRYRPEDSQIHPYFVETLSECAEWEVIEIK